MCARSFHADHAQAIAIAVFWLGYLQGKWKQGSEVPYASFCCGGGVGDVGFEASTYFRCKLAYDIDGTMTRVAQLNLPDCTVRKVNLEDQSVLLGTVHTQ